jgi:kynurenine formamidase
MVYLSYELSESTPLYGGSKDVKLVQARQMIKGDTCNIMNLSFPTHCGTHIDLPYHFDPEGQTLSDYSADPWLFDKIEVIDISGKVNDKQMIKQDMFPQFNKKDIDLLLIKTGYGQYRGTDRYTMTPPGIASEVADWLRVTHPTVRCVGMDLISVSSFSNREEGRRAHRAFLAPESGKPILLLEDVKLEHNGPYERVIIAPLLIEGADGAPCTVFGFEGR